MTNAYRRLKAWFIGQLTATKSVAAPAHSTGATSQNDHEEAQNVVPYDENLLERSRTQWQFGDWESLTKLERDTLQHHPDRAKLALLAAAGHLQQGDSQAARQFTRLAQDWGCSKKLISQILISGVHNSLGRAAAIGDRQPYALKHFESAVAIGMPASDNRLLIKARVGEQYAQLKLAEEACHRALGNACNDAPVLTDTNVKVNISEVENPYIPLLKKDQGRLLRIIERLYP